jgi:prepilin-type N-terminal cleavage/methylation domain-containing protein
MRKKTAFSLVELSIVLIIIGLLVAGVVGGSSLIKSSALRTVMSEARNYSVITNSFFVAYDELPGDIRSGGYTSPSTSALSTGCAGDNDGKIEYMNGTTTGATFRNTAEGLCAIYQLKDAGMLQTENLLPPGATTPSATGDLTKLRGGSGTARGSTGRGKGTTSGGGGGGGGGTPVATSEIGALIAGNHYPKSKYSGNGWVYDYVSGSSDETSSFSWRSVGLEAEPANVVFFIGSRLGVENATTETELAGSTTSNTFPALPADDSSSIDKKVDDGVPNAGKVRAFGTDKSTGKTDTGDCTTTVSGVTKYATDNDNYSCIIGFSVDVLS